MGGDVAFKDLESCAVVHLVGLRIGRKSIVIHLCCRDRKKTCAAESKAQPSSTSEKVNHREFVVARHE